MTAPLDFVKILLTNRALDLMVAFNKTPSSTDNVGYFREIITQNNQGVPFIVIGQQAMNNLESYRSFKLQSLHAPQFDPYTLMEVLVEFSSNPKTKNSFSEYLLETRGKEIGKKLNKAFDLNAAELLKEIFENLEWHGFSSPYFDAYNDNKCLNLINAAVLLVAGKKLDFKNHSPESYLSKVPSHRYITFRNIGLGHLRNFDASDFSGDPAIEGPEQVRQVLKVNPALAALSVIDFIRTNLQETEDNVSKADIDLLMNLRKELSHSN